MNRVRRLLNLCEDVSLGDSYKVIEDIARSGYSINDNGSVYYLDTLILLEKGTKVRILSIGRERQGLSFYIGTSKDNTIQVTLDELKKSFKKV